MINFDIKFKTPIKKLKFHKDAIRSLILLKDGRFASSSDDKSIIIYNKKTFSPDLIIKSAHNDSINDLINLSSGFIISCSIDWTIKLYNNIFKVIQILNYHKGPVYKIIELNNKKLVSCSYDFTIIFYNKYNNKYKIDFQISTIDLCFNIIQTKENE